MLKLLYLLLLCFLAACTSPQVQDQSAEIIEPGMTTVANMADGYQLPLTLWESKEKPQAMILALHGFNDYRNAFRNVGQFFAAHGFLTYAYDQRSFGETRQRGIWPGDNILEADAAAMAKLLCSRHPGLPLFLLGESMGGAVVMNLQYTAPCIKGFVLSAPAVWGWQTMPFWQSYLLRFAAHIVPGKKLTGEWLDIKPSDNLQMLQALGRDPLVIKATRIDAIFGLTNLMESALLASSELELPTLLLYGEKDEIIPHIPVCNMINRLPDNRDIRIVLYPEGYHMLMRDLQADIVLNDILAWSRDQATDLPSEQEVSKTSSRLNIFCR